MTLYGSRLWSARVQGLGFRGIQGLGISMYMNVRVSGYRNQGLRGLKARASFEFVRSLEKRRGLTRGL